MDRLEQVLEVMPVVVKPTAYLRDVVQGALASIAGVCDQKVHMRSTSGLHSPEHYPLQMTGDLVDARGLLPKEDSVTYNSTKTTFSVDKSKSERGHP